VSPPAGEFQDGNTIQDDTTRQPPGSPTPAAPRTPELDQSSTLRLQVPAITRLGSKLRSSPVVRPASEKPAIRPASTISYDSPNPANRYQRQSRGDNAAAKTPPTPGFIGPLGYDVVQ
jgi:hypothetical protein